MARIAISARRLDQRSIAVKVYEDAISLFNTPGVDPETMEKAVKKVVSHSNHLFLTDTLYNIAVDLFLRMEFISLQQGKVYGRTPKYHGHLLSRQALSCLLHLDNQLYNEKLVYLDMVQYEDLDLDLPRENYPSGMTYYFVTPGLEDIYIRRSDHAQARSKASCHIPSKLFVLAQFLTENGENDNLYQLWTSNDG